MKQKKYNEVLKEVLGVSIETKYDSRAIVEIIEHPEEYPLIADKVKSDFASFVKEYQDCKSCGGKCENCEYNMSLMDDIDGGACPFCIRYDSQYYKQGSFDAQKWASDYEGELSFASAEYFSDLVYYLTDLEDGNYELWRNDQLDGDVLYHEALELYKAYLKVFLTDMSTRDPNVGQVTFGVHYRLNRHAWGLSVGAESYENVSRSRRDSEFDVLNISSKYYVFEDEEPFYIIEDKTELQNYYHPYCKKDVTDNDGNLLPQAKATLFELLGKVDFEGLKLKEENKVALPTRTPAEGWKYDYYAVRINGNTLVFRTDKADPALTPIRDLILDSLTDESKELEAVQRILKSVQKD